MGITWIVVANASQAKFFSVNKIKFLNDKDKLILVEELFHHASRMHDADIVSDKVGRYRAMANSSDSFMEPTDPHKHEAEVFARETANYLENARAKKLFQDLILVVSPSFYGLLNLRIHPQLKKLISKVIEKDYTKDSDQVLAKHLRQQIG